MLNGKDELRTLPLPLHKNLKGPQVQSTLASRQNLRFYRVGLLAIALQNIAPFIKSYPLRFVDGDDLAPYFLLWEWGKKGSCPQTDFWGLPSKTKLTLQAVSEAGVERSEAASVGKPSPEEEVDPEAEKD